MGAVEIKVPRLAESISEGVLVAWLRQDGEVVGADEPIATLETDKAAVEIPADRAGVLRHARKVGDTVEVGDVIARIEEAPAGAPAPGAGAVTTRKGAQERKSRGPAPEARPSPTGGPRVASAADAPRDLDGMSPAVRRMVEEFGLDPGEIEGSGKGGRLLKEDVQRHLGERGRADSESAPAPSAPAPSAPADRPPTDAPARVADPSRPRTAGSSGSPAVAPWVEDEVERAVPMSRIRQRIAERLVQAQRTAAILTTFNEVDMGPVMDLRARFRDSFERRHGVKLSYMSFFTRACVIALQQIPELHAEVRGPDIVYKRHVHMGIAVQTERGLVVPVAHHVEQRSFAEVEKEIARLAAAARENRLTLDELSGGTFTISNGGVFGSLLSTPILNPPQSGILGMHKIEKRPVVVDDRIVARPMMYLALSYDHRIVDGEQAVTFLVSVKERLEDPERMLIEV